MAKLPGMLPNQESYCRTSKLFDYIWGILVLSKCSPSLHTCIVFWCNFAKCFSKKARYLRSVMHVHPYLGQIFMKVSASEVINCARSGRQWEQHCIMLFVSRRCSPAIVINSRRFAHNICISFYPTCTRFRQKLALNLVVTTSRLSLLEWKVWRQLVHNFCGPLQ